MRFSSFETVSITAHRDGLPARIEQRAASVAVFLQLIFLLSILALFALPYLALGASLATEPEVRDTIAERPGTLLAIMAGLAAGALLLGLPAIHCLQRLGRRREITLTKGYVEVVDRDFWGRAHWGCPLGEFSGVAHHVHTNLSGARHELILVHPVARCCLLLRIDDRISLEDTQSLADLLGLPMVPASALYARRSSRGLASGGFSTEHQNIEARERMGCP